MDLDRAATAHRLALGKVDAVKRANAARLQAARDRAEATRVDLAAAIVEDYLRRGARVGDLARRSGYSRETVRTILRAAGVEAPSNG